MYRHPSIQMILKRATDTLRYQGDVVAAKLKIYLYTSREAQSIRSSKEKVFDTKRDWPYWPLKFWQYFNYAICILVNSGIQNSLRYKCNAWNLIWSSMHFWKSWRILFILFLEQKLESLRCYSFSQN